MSPFIKNPISHQPAFNLCPNAMQLHWNNSFPTSGNGCLFSAPCSSIDALVLGFSFFPPLPGDLSPIVGRTSGWHGRNWPHYSTYHLNKKCGGCFVPVFFRPLSPTSPPALWLHNYPNLSISRRRNSLKYANMSRASGGDWRAQLHRQKFTKVCAFFFFHFHSALR